MKTGKFDLPGIRDKGAQAIKAALLKTGFGVAVYGGPFAKLFNFAVEQIIEYLANRGIVILNLGVIKIDEKVDPALLMKALEEGLLKAEKPGLTEAEGKALDEQVKKAFRRAVRYNRK